jgi:hypothetical protein
MPGALSFFIKEERLLALEMRVYFQRTAYIDL